MAMAGDAAQRKHVLVVNAAPVFLDLARELLRDERYDVTTTSFVPRAFDQIAALQPDLLLIDLTAGERVGWDLLERLQREVRTRGIPVIVTSTDPRLLDRAGAHAGRYGADYLLAMPFDIAELVGATHTLIGAAEGG